MMFADYHIHTYYSDDSTYPMEQVVKDAISKGITDLCFTDHVDYGIKEDTQCTSIQCGLSGLCGRISGFKGKIC